MDPIITSSINFLILVGFMVYKLRQPVIHFVSQRHHSIRDELQRVREQLHQAQEKYDEFSAKLKAIDVEVSALREQTKQDTVAMKQRIVNEARRIAAMAAVDAKNAADGLFIEFKGQLYSEWSAQVLERAECLLKKRLTGDDQARIRQEFSQQMEIVQ